MEDSTSLVGLDGETGELMSDETNGNVISLIGSNNNNNTLNVNGNKNSAGTGKKEDEKITTAVMKVLQGYQWSLVPTTTK